MRNKNRNRKRIINLKRIQCSMSAETRHNRFIIDVVVVTPLCNKIIIFFWVHTARQWLDEYVHCSYFMFYGLWHGLGASPYGACWCFYCYNDAASRLWSCLSLLLLEHPRVLRKISGEKWKNEMHETKPMRVMLLSFNRSTAHISS